MGVAESREPVTEKTVSEGNSYNLIFGLCEMQGWRPDMVKTFLFRKMPRLLKMMKMLKLCYSGF